MSKNKKPPKGSQDLPSHGKVTRSLSKGRRVSAGQHIMQKQPL